MVHANNYSHLDHFYSLLIHILQRLKHSGHHFAVELILTKIERLVGWLVVLVSALDILLLLPLLPHTHTKSLNLTATVTLWQ